MLPHSKAEVPGKRSVPALAIMCRQYNDVGSLARDLEERNLNSVNFPEFAAERSFSAHVSGNEKLLSATTDGDQHLVMNNSQSELLQAQQSELWGIAAYERDCLDLAALQLRDLLEEEVMEKLRVFIDVTDLYGQLYVAKDLTSRIDKG